VPSPYWIMNGMMVIKLPAVLGAQLRRGAGLTFFGYMVLATLSEQPGRSMRMSELAATISASLSRLSHVASRLGACGCLTRQRCPGPGRATNATLTGTGYAKVAAAAPGHLQAVRDYLIDILTRASCAASPPSATASTTALAPPGPGTSRSK
jgi:DNA-binding MarR family transcriptional regulator